METVEFQNLHGYSYARKESLRALKTNIQFCGDDIKTILFTSALPNEGKSTVVFDLARSLTESGKRVLLIDTDMRKSVMIGRHRAKTTNGKGIRGLSHYLSGQNKMTDVLYTTQIPKLMVVFAGPAVPNPTEILEKKYFDQLLELGKENFDYVLIDSAPVGAAIDAAVIARKCDGAVLVVGQGEVSSRLIVSVKNQLELSGVRILGAILNKVKLETSHYGKYYGKYYGSYYGSYYGKYYGNSGK